MKAEGTRYPLVIAALLLVLNFSLGVNFVGIAPILPTLMDDLGIGRGLAGLLAGLSMALMAVASIPGGYLAIRIGLKRIIAVGWLLSGAMVLAPLADTFGALLILRVALGLGSALVFPAAGPLIMHWFRPAQAPMMTGAMMAAMSAGVAVSLFITAPLAQSLGWQAALAVEGGLAVAGAVAWLLLGRMPNTATAGEQEPRFSLRQMRQALLSKTTLLIVAADAGPFAQYIAMTSWLPTFYHEELGMSLTRAGFISGLLPFVGIFAVIGGGVLLARVERRRPLLVVLGFMACICGFGAFLLGEGVLLYLAIVGLGIASWGYLPSLMTIPMELPGASSSQVAMTWAMFMSTGGVISFLSPLAVGVITDSVGTYVPGFTVLAVLALSLVVAGMALPEIGTRGRLRGRATAST